MQPAKRSGAFAAGACAAQVGGYRAFQPAASLRAIVDVCWVHESLHGGNAGHHRVLPDAGSALVLYCRRDGRGRTHDAEVYLHGPIATPRMFDVASQRELVGVTLHPEWLPWVIPAAAREHHDGIVPLRDLAPELAGRCLSMLERTRCAHDALIRLVEWTAARSSGATSSVPRRLQRALQLLRSRRGNVRVRALARAAAYSERQLRRATSDALGLTPKQLARQLRFLAVIEAADGVAHPSWADLAARFGYFDQAHLITESWQLGRASPTVIHAERRAQH